jgi:hypothetical protein
MDINNLKESSLVKYTGLIVIGLIIVYILYQFISYYNNKREVEASFFGVRDLFGQFRDTTKYVKIAASRFKPSEYGKEYSYSFWFKVDNWNYLYGTPKHIFHSGDEDMTSMSPGVFLHPTKNQLIVRVDTNETSNYYRNNNKQLNGELIETREEVSELDCRKTCNTNSDCNSFSLDQLTNKCSFYKSTVTNTNQNNSGIKSFIKEKNMDPNNFSDFELDASNPCDLVDIPLQRWNHVVIILWNRNLDVYLNGKLARSCALRGIPSIYGNGLFVTKNGGFRGDMAGLRYFNKAISASEVYDIYKEGPERLNVRKRLLPNFKIKLSAEATSAEDETA